jgi:hypothetical protein
MAEVRDHCPYRDPTNSNTQFDQSVCAQGMLYAWADDAWQDETSQAKPTHERRQQHRQ